MIVDLTAEDAMCASSIATLQILRKIAKGRNGDHGGRSKRGMRERWADGIHGVMAEIALARALDVAHTPGGLHVSRGDVGVRSKVEVRATEVESGHLLVYSEDKDESIFVLMIGHFPKFRIAGFISGADAKKAEWFREDKDPPGFWVPQGSLDKEISRLRR